MASLGPTSVKILILYDFIKWIIRLRWSIRLTMFLPDCVVLDKTSHNHMRSYCSWVAEYSQIPAGFAWEMYQPCLLISCVVLRNLNEFIKLSTDIGIYPFCIVHSCPIHLWTAANNLNRLKRPCIYVKIEKINQIFFSKEMEP